MKTETALTAFCITTVMLIVGLVTISSGSLKPSTTGHFIGIPVVYEGAQEPSNVVNVKADSSDPLCYQKGVIECDKHNKGRAFVWCADNVAHQCGIPHEHLEECVLPPGFEAKYSSSRHCRYGVIDECAAWCRPSEKDQCVKLSKTRCSFIGGKYQGAREINWYQYAYSQ